MAIQAGALRGMVRKSTKKWTTQKKKEERSADAYWNRRAAMTKTARVTVKDAAHECLEEAYMRASSGDTLPASARQIMYAARKHILERIGKKTLDSGYFRTVLKDYIQDNGLEDVWDVAFDERGNLYEPHTKKKIPQGTLQVREYLAKLRGKWSSTILRTAKGKSPQGLVGNPPKFTDVQYPTVGADNRFSGVLLVEKEGFMPLFKAVKLAERYDLAILANKGQSVDATRRLIDTMCAVDGGVPLFIVRDFDVAGFSIAQTCHKDGEHYHFENEVDAIDLGLRLQDVEDFELSSEPVFVLGDRETIEDRLLSQGATEEEVEFLIPEDEVTYNAKGKMGINGQRVELNEFSSGKFIEWLESKFEEHGVEKVVPDEDVLDEAYRRAYELECFQEIIEEHKDEIEESAMALELPDDLEKKIRKKLKKKPHWSWDKALNKIVKKQKKLDSLAT